MIYDLQVCILYISSFKNLGNSYINHATFNICETVLCTYVFPNESVRKYIYICKHYVRYLVGRSLKAILVLRNISSADLRYHELYTYIRANLTELGKSKHLLR